MDDNPGDARLLQEILREGAEPFELVHAESLAEALEVLDKARFDTLLLDLSLPDAAGLDTVLRVREHSTDTPIIVLTGMDDERLGLKAVQAGAQDYLVKGQVDGSLLFRTIRYAIERHRMIEELEQTRRQQLEMKDQFLSHASHELRSPLTTIHQFTTILKDGLAGDLNAEQHEYLEIILRNSNQLRAMISDLLDVTRAGNGKLTIDPQCVSVVDLLGETVQSLKNRATEKGIMLYAEEISFVLPVLVDPSRAHQVLANLVENALKFTPMDGTVRLKAEHLQDEPGFIRFSVSDSGCGISAEGTQRIFDRLYQEPNGIEASRKGLGIGLYICKELVTRHGGRIWVESEMGVGSTFHFTLPIFPVAGILASLSGAGQPGSAGLDMVRVDLQLSEGFGQQLTEAVRKQVWAVLHQSVLPGEEMLFPRLCSNERAESYFLAVSASPDGASYAARAIREQLTRTLRLQEIGINFNVTYFALGISPDMFGEALEEHGMQFADTDNLIRAAQAEGRREPCLQKS